MPPFTGLDSERTLRAPATAVRKAIIDALRAQGLDITADQLTRIEARRGSRLTASLVFKKSMPLQVTYELRASGDTCAVVGHLTDNYLNVLGKTWGLNQQYRGLFQDVQQAVDRALAKLDPAGAAGFAEASFWSKAGDVAILEQTYGATARLGGTAVEKANMALEGGAGTRGPSAWKGVDAVTFVCGSREAVLALEDVQAHLGIAVMISSLPGTLPPNLAAQVEALARRVEEALTAARGQPLQVQIDDAERPVLDFLHQQVRVRGGLPVRTLHVCRSCRFEKVTNPDYQRLTTRNQRLRSIVGGVGATVSSGGIQPFVVLGQVFKFKKLDPDYVCPRCQGLDAEERVVTFCPGCGDLRPEAALRLCPKCKHDFRQDLGTEDFWLDPPAMPAATPPAATPAATPAAAAPPSGWGQPPAATPAATPSSASPSPSGWGQPAAATPAATPAAAAPPSGWGQPAAATAPSEPRSADQVAPAYARPEDVPMGTPPMGRKRGKECQLCRREYPSLWRIVIRTPFGFEERFVCGSPAGCSIPSVTTPIQV